MSNFEIPASWFVEVEAARILETESDMLISEHIVSDFVEYVISEFGEEDDFTFIDFGMILRHHYGIEPNGDLNLYSGDGRNIVLWSGCSANYLVAVSKLLADPRVFLWQTWDLTDYALAGVRREYPLIASKDSGEAYDEPHWLPAVVVRAAD